MECGSYTVCYSCVYCVQVCGDPGVVPPGRYRRGSVSHSWSETVVSSNSTAAVSDAAGSGGGGGGGPERLYTPVDELLSAAQRQVRAGVDTPAGSTVTDDGPYSGTTTRVITADYSDTRQSVRSIFHICNSLKKTSGKTA